jgi:hypothetical protein
LKYSVTIIFYLNNANHFGKAALTMKSNGISKILVIAGLVVALGVSGIVSYAAGRAAGNGKMRERAKAWCEKNPEKCKEVKEKAKQKREQLQKWCKANPDECKKKKEELKEKRNKYQAWCKSNPDECKAKKEQLKKDLVELMKSCKKNQDTCNEKKEGFKQKYKDIPDNILENVVGLADTDSGK